MLDFNVALNTHTDQDHIETTNVPPPAARDPFDLAPVRQGLKKYEDEITRAKQTATDHQVVDDDSNRTAIEMASQAKRLGKTIEDVRKDKIRPYQEYVKGVNNLAKVYTEMLDTIERTLKGKINAWLTKQKLEKLEAERRAQEAARELQAKLDAESAEKGLPQVEVPLPVLPQKTEPVRTEEGSASQRKVWKWKISDPAAIPREYLQVDTVAVNSAVRAGARTIPGIEIYQEENVQIRV